MILRPPTFAVRISNTSKRVEYLFELYERYSMALLAVEKPKRKKKKKKKKG